jgi:hypothetical protein
MGWRVAADIVMIVHLTFVVFVVLGGLLTWRWPRAAAVHVAAALYGIVILLVGFTCPLTPLEKALRSQAGQAGYDGGFVEHYVVGVLYPGEFTPLVQASMVVGLLGINVGAYTVMLRRRRSRAATLT